MFQRQLAKANLSYQVPALVLGSSKGKYIISVNGSKYMVKDGVNVKPLPNTSVWVCIPNNDWNQAYICAKR